MAETATAARYRALVTQLTQAGSEAWGTRIYNMQAPPNAQRPYVVIVPASDIDPLWSRVPGDMAVDYVKCIADDMITAMTGAGRIQQLLHDAGVNDNALPGYGPPSQLAGGASWQILTATHISAIHLVENVEGQRSIYTDGGQYRFRMERV